MNKVILCFLLLVPCFAYSDSKTDKIEELMKAQGLLEIWQQQLDIRKIESDKQVKQVTDTMLSSLNPNKEFQAKFQKISSEFNRKLTSQMTAKHIVEVWAKFYGTRFTDAELDQLLAFYTSNIAQKEVQETKKAMIEFTSYFSKENEALMKVALKEYMTELGVLGKSCNCPKKK
jgi:hypothetical protein